MDVHQHTYDLYETLDQKRGDEVKKYDREFEQKNTYSNVLSMKYPWLNLLVLNFPYHNAHHKQPGRPWYLLPRLHNELYGDDDTQVLSFADLLKSYHRYRVKRILNGDAINSPVKTLGPDFVGVDGVSFLVTI
jgi:fatty acid desaturase